MSIDKLLHKVALGKLKQVPSELAGGALHKILEVVTDQGKYAIKVLNPHVSTRSELPKNYEFTESISAKFAEKGLPSIPALSIDRQYVQSTEDGYYLIYPYIDGQLLPHAELGKKHVDKIGAIYAMMHSCEVFPELLSSSDYDCFDNSHWDSVISHCSVSELSPLLGKIHQWNDTFYQSIPLLDKNLVVTHRDMHRSNVLWGQPSDPYIIDWESAGPMNPLMEVIGFGLEWSGILIKQTIDHSLLSALLISYLKHSKVKLTSADIDAAFYGWLGHCVLAWTEFNIKRMIGEISRDNSEITRGKKIITQAMLPCLQYIAEHEHRILSNIHNIML